MRTILAASRTIEALFVAEAVNINELKRLSYSRFYVGWKQQARHHRNDALISGDDASASPKRRDLAPAAKKDWRENMSAAEGTKNLSPRRAKTLAQMNAVTDEEVVAFIGRSADRFLPTWEKMREQARGERTFIWSWCWPAFFLGFAWFMYRKMYTMAAVFLFLPILLVLFTPLGDSVGAGYNGALGALGKQMYLGHARTKVQKIKERAASPEEAAEKIARAGGVSIAGGVIGGLIWVGCLILALAPLL